MSADKPLREAVAANTDRELYREPTGELPGDYYADSLHVTSAGTIGMNVGGTVITLPIAEWHRRAVLAEESSSSCGKVGHPTFGHDCAVSDRVRHLYADDEPAEVAVEEREALSAAERLKFQKIEDSGDTRGLVYAVARLKADTLRDHDAALTAKAKAAALREAANDAVPKFNNHPLNTSNVVTDWLRERAAREES